MKIILTVFVLSTVLISQGLYAQSISFQQKTNPGFVNYQDDEENDFFDWKSSGETNFFISTDQPTLEFIYGMSSLSIYEDKFDNDFSDAMSGEFRIGYTSKSLNFTENNIMRFEYNYFFLGNTSTDYMTASEVGDDLETDAWRFGFGWQSGYGYKFSDNFDLTLYHGDGLVWTKVDFKDTALPAADQSRMEFMEGEFRFGDFMEAGLKMQVFAPVSINAAFERHIVFPRHMFWYWTASEIIEAAAKGLAGKFAKVVMKSSPAAGPIVYFILQNGVAYGMFELRKRYMNWPIESAPPLMYETYRVGLTFTF